MNHKFTEAFGILLDRYIRVTSDDEVLVIYDESIRPFSDSLLSAVSARALSTTFINIPKSYQHALIGWSKESQDPATFQLPAGVVSALSDSTAVLNLLDGELDTGRIRRSILHQQRLNEGRLAHIPGLTEEILRVLSVSDIESISNNCEQIAWCLGQAKQTTVVTNDLSGQQYHLSLDLESWENEPLISSGVLVQGSWGNIPPGESFICPSLSAVSGEICINGSVPGYAIKDGEEVVLSFREGKLRSWQANQESPATKLFHDEQLRARHRGDNNWNSFAELGLGLNPAITELSGNSLFDEKAGGTLHIAIGDNSGFGHPIVSDIHADLVTRNPTISIDGIEIITLGDINNNEIASLRAQHHADTIIPPNKPIGIDAAKIDIISNRLYRRLSAGGRIGHIKLSDDEENRALVQLTQILGTDDEVVSDEILSLYPTIEDFSTLHLLETLGHYRALHM